MEQLHSFVNGLDLTLMYCGFVVAGFVFCVITLMMGGDDGGAAGHDFLGFHHSGSDGPGCFVTPSGMSFFTTSLGAYGLIMQYGFKAGPLTGVLVSVVLAAVTMMALNYAFYRVFWKSGSVVKAEDLTGVQAEVFTAIPANGLGEVIYRDSRGRQKQAARSATNQALPEGTLVVIKSNLGAALVVEKVDNTEAKAAE